jgi:serine protease
MAGIDLLRALAAHREGHDRTTGLDASTLRFVVEYAAAVDVVETRAEIERLLGIEDVELFALFEDPSPDDELGVFHVLQLPGLERTMDNGTLFSIAHELRDLLGAVTVEPDIGSEFYQEPVAPGAVDESVVKDRFVGSCFVAGAAPVDRTWALERAGVLRAWGASPARGAGIRIGQPDTGITPHVELSDVTIRDGFNVLTGAADAVDPLSGGGNPGHGTGTASVVASGPSGEVLGPAPEATLVPIRCVESVVLAFNGSAVARAIDHARQRGCHVVTMSLGGTPSRAMRQAIKRAIDEGMIVLAAAGNCVDLVVYPARYDEVIAVAGSNVDDGTWRGSCHGSAVDVTAPAEKVWKAVARPGNSTVAGGQGTSFAVALTAGVAALWLSHHGRDTVLAAARARQMSVQALFRDVLTTTVRVPARWETDEFGAGIVDAQAVLQAPLEGPVPAAPEAAPASTTADAMHLLVDALGPVGAARLADAAAQPQLQLELSSVMFEDARIGAGLPEETDLESRLSRHPMSPQLEAAIGVAGPPSARPPAPGPTRPEPRTDRIPSVDPVVLVVGRRSGLESAADLTPEAARESLRADPGSALGVLEDKVRRVRADSDEVDAQRLTPLHDQLLRDAERVIGNLCEGEPVPGDPGSETALEALVELEGRPALRLGDDGVDPDDPELGEWQGAVVLHPTFAVKQRSVGRIDSAPGVHAGTGFVVGEGLVMTNRHVVELLAFPTPRRSDPAGWVLGGAPSINFSPSAADTTRRFRILEVVFSGPDPIEGRVDLAHLDLALVRVEQTNADGVELPSPLTLSTQTIAPAASRLFVVGYPAMPTVLPSDEDGRRRMDVVRRLQELFGMQYGVRYLSPGLVMTSRDAVPDSPRGWVFTHDATSLGGNSGSCVLSFDDDLDVTGLHFAGNWLRANYAHAMELVAPAIERFVP